jgi:hypothetical protein
MSQPPSPNNRRRRLRVVDDMLQTWLLVLLVVMESVLVTAAIWFLYRQLDAAVDENLYRVHFTGSVDMLTLLVREGLPVIGVLLLANLGALLVADRIWVCYVNNILGHLGALVSASANLDLRPLPPPPASHAVLDQAIQWREGEAQYLAQVRALVAVLPQELPPPGERAATAEILARLRQ